MEEKIKKQTKKDVGVLKNSFKTRNPSFKRVRVFQIDLEFISGDFEKRKKEKPLYSEKNLPEKRREPKTNSTHIYIE